MRTEVIQYDGDLKREVWTFYFLIGSFACIYLDSYSLETKLSRRHKRWEKQAQWERLDRRGNNIDDPPLPPSVIDEAREGFISQLKQIPIVKGG